MPFDGAEIAALAGRLAKQQERMHEATLAHRFRAGGQGRKSICSVYPQDFGAVRSPTPAFMIRRIIKIKEASHETDDESLPAPGCLHP